MSMRLIESLSIYFATHVPHSLRTTYRSAFPQGIIMKEYKGKVLKYIAVRSFATYQQEKPLKIIDLCSEMRYMSTIKGRHRLAEQVVGYVCRCHSFPLPLVECAMGIPASGRYAGSPPGSPTPLPRRYSRQSSADCGR